MKKTGQNFFHVTFSVALAAVIAAAAAGCSGNNGPHTSTAPSDAPQATTVTATIPFPSSGESVESGKADDSGKTSDTDEKESNSSAAAASGAAAAETTENADSDRTAAAADAADTASTASETADAGDPSYDSSSTADAADADTTGTGAEYAEDFVAAAIEDGVPERSEPDTSLKESSLSEALVECTGWGQSAGSSLHAASSAVQLLLWANQVEAGSVDSDLLKETVAAEVKRLSDSQQENLKLNWSSVSYDASLILDDFQEISPLLEDGGCSAAAKEASENKDSVKNWEALEHALNAALK